MSTTLEKVAKTPQQGGLRQAMAWLHTWCGLWISWLLFAIFLTGTLAVFDDPIGHWMTPEHALEEAAHANDTPPPKVTDRANRLALALDFMEKEHPKADMWEIWPVQRPGQGLSAYWFQPSGGYGSAELNPLTGALVEHAPDANQRDTIGGHHFVDFHYELHAGRIGVWIVGITTMIMLVALVSGVITHKRIFKDFFTFRPAKGQRSWLDAHNAVAVLTLPFQFMIAYTGIAFFSDDYVPAPVVAQYGMENGKKAFLSDWNDVGKPARIGQPMAIPDLEQYALRAEQTIHQEIRAVVLDNPNDASMRVCMYGWNEESDKLQRISANTGMACYALATGEQIAVRQPGKADSGPAGLTRIVMSNLHMAAFGGTPMRWLYFFCGLAGTAMMGTGAILFMVKRRQRAGGEFGSATERVYRMIECLNVAAIAGLAVACIGYLWANRLIPVGIEHRAGWEVRAFFGLWFLMLVHACLRPEKRGWIEQLALLAVLCVLLPVLNVLSTGDNLVAQITRGDWESAGVELCSVAFGLLAAWGAWKVHKRKEQPLKKAARENRSAPASLQTTMEGH
ncbi:MULTISPECIES: PepSY domain-containing protein [unclassified Janthinobacterium]|uniref:PepSY-associated TM helix domain-containing protein n=1 Tax=unclassified Janthinobacterium TaxID=2610881 RepID=UPI0018084873|nr:MULTISPECIES: PepSY-associated TM helix domain-containing protein [unclassified Janthinobacterium]MBB5607560.1 putative iron-regulated membrane protein [Janthinobacterium sp. S3T4]MBB5612582.1 putative iron-regulated membrane protein [Janthinobacterium sp. S3M3]